jgi:hypothetical protein
VDKDELTNWALGNGWQMIAGCLSLTKPSAPREAIVRMVLKATVVNVEVKRPAGKWHKIAGESYTKIKADPETGLATGAGVRHNFRLHTADGRQQESSGLCQAGSAARVRPASSAITEVRNNYSGFFNFVAFLRLLASVCHPQEAAQRIG